MTRVDSPYNLKLIGKPCQKALLTHDQLATERRSMAILAEAYIHLNPFHADENGLRALATELEQRWPLIAGKIYNSSVELGIRIEEGSLKTWVIVIGVLYVHVSNWPQFKDGIYELYIDGKYFVEQVARVTQMLSGASPNQIYRVERRTKTVGKIYHLIKEVDRLNQQAPKLSETEFHDKKLNLSHRFYELLGEMSDGRDQDLLKEAMLPADLTPLPKPKDDLYGRYLLAPREFDWGAPPGPPVLQSATVGPDVPRLSWPTTILLKDGRRLILDTAGSKQVRSR